MLQTRKECVSCLHRWLALGSHLLSNPRTRQVFTLCQLLEIHGIFAYLDIKVQTNMSTRPKSLCSVGLETERVFTLLRSSSGNSTINVSIHISSVTNRGIICIAMRSDLYHTYLPETRSSGALATIVRDGARTVRPTPTGSPSSMGTFFQGLLPRFG